MKGFDVLFAEQIESWQGEGNRESAMFQTLYERFVQPNEETFRQNYKANCRLENAAEYETCILDFIPIADQEYFVLDRGAERVCGTFTVKPYEVDEGVEKTFTSILIADSGDIREILPIIWKKRWQNVYIVLNEELRRFASYFKLEGFSAVFPSNVKIFATTSDMRQYFLENHDAYLPRKVFSQEPEKYDAVIEELHDTRVRSGIPSNHVFLSVCVPSFNRGDRALQTVQHFLTTKYDAEIEIVLVNTGSTIRTEGYQQIKEMRDSRLRYYKQEKNGRYYVSYCISLSKASGHFAMTLSDEDLVEVENLDEIFEYLYLHQTIGATTFNAIFEDETYKKEKALANLVREPKMCRKGVEGIKWVFDWTRYISGLCFNYDYLKKANIFGKVEKQKNNFFFHVYAHCVFCALIANEYMVTNSGIGGWRYGKGEFNFTMIDWEGSCIYPFFPKPRMEQERAAMNFLGDILHGRDLDELFDYQVNDTFNLLSLNYKDDAFCPPDKLASSFSWLNIWRDHYENCLQILQDLEGKFGDISAVRAKMDKSFLYWQICKRAQRRHTAEENLLPSLQAQVAKYYHEKGVPFEKIDFEGIEKDLESWVQAFLAERS